MYAELWIGDVRRARGNTPRPGETLYADELWSNLERVLAVGGRWQPGTPTDPRGRWLWRAGDDKDHEDRPRSVLKFRIHRGQEPAARWFAEWLRYYRMPREQRLAVYAPALPTTTCLLRGGRRSGKTHLADVILALFCFEIEYSETDALSPIRDTSFELIGVLKKILHPSQYRIEKPKDGPQTFVLANGSQIRIRSGRAYRKSGRCDLGFMNEAQQQPRSTMVEIGGATMDYHGLTLMAANPASEVCEAWIDDYFEACVRGDVDGVAFEMNAKENPLITPEAIASMRKNMSRREGEREIDGKAVAFDDAVMHEWSDDNWSDPPEAWTDITAAFLNERLRTPAPIVIGMDFQRTPHMSARALKIYKDKAGNVHPWVIGEWDVEGDEAALVRALEADDVDFDVVPVIADASGWWQDGEHRDGAQSDRALRAAGVKHLFRPAPQIKRNPRVTERMKNANRLLCNGEGLRALHVAKTCTNTAEAFRRYERNKFGEPSRRSRWAHAIDCVTYVLWRLFPPVATSARAALHRPEQGFTKRGTMMRPHHIPGRADAFADDDVSASRRGRSASGRDVGW